METETELDARATLMTQAANTLLEIELLETDVAERGVSIAGARGNWVSNPSLAALARHRLVLAKILQTLEAPESNSEKAKRAARARWEKAKQPRPVAGSRVFIPRQNGDE
jgi:hypothetical protein